MSTCSRTFPGRAESVAEARRWAARSLIGCPGVADVVLCLSELVTNAVTHSRSGVLRGGSVRVRISAAPGVWVRIEVRDDGPTSCPVPAVAEAELACGGRGLYLVRELAGGHAGADGRGLYWARLPWIPGEVPPPEPWGARWLAVMERAGWRCECSGQCGRAGHRCASGHAPGYSLHVVPTVPVGEAVAVTLPACALVALCAACRAGAERVASRADDAMTRPDMLFVPDGGGGTR